MYNRLKAYFQQPQKGWDPVSAAYAAQYAQVNLHAIDENLLKIFNEWCGGFKGKSLVDLGAGPGQYTLAFLERGARVTWWDVSRHYLDLAKKQIREQGLEATYVLDYMDHLQGQYDLLFNRVCWYYCFNDTAFLKTIYEAMAPGGAACLVLHNEYRVFHNQLPWYKKFALQATFYLNEWFNIKIGHVMPSTKKIHRIFGAYPFREIQIREYGNHADSILVLFKK